MCQIYLKSGFKHNKMEINKEDKERMDKLKEAFKITFHKKMNRVYWEHKYLMALAVIDNIEGMIGMRKKEKVTLPLESEGEKSE